MKRSFGTLPASSGAKKQKSKENTEKKTPESTEAQLEPVILPEIVNIRTEDAQSIDDHPLLSKTGLNLELVKEEYVIQENQTKNPNKVKKMNDQRSMMIQNHVPQATCSRNGVQVFHPLQNQDETSSKNQGKFVPNSKSGNEPEISYVQYEIIELEDEESCKRFTKNDQIFKEIILGKKQYTLNVKSVLINCLLCPKIFNNSESFIRHVFNHHRFYVCLACNLNFDRSTFRKHVYQSHEARPLLECVACKFSATTLPEWRLHLQEHLEKSLEKIRQKLLPHVERISCPFCMFSYLKKHFVTHLKSEHRFFECVACDYYAASFKDLTQHLNVEHRNGDTFDCKKCRFSAASVIEWTEHFTSGDHDRGPTKIGDFSCTKCFFNTSIASQVHIHLQRVHSIFCCIFCDEFETNNVNILWRHTNKKHNVPHNPKHVKCNICPYSGENPGLSHIEHFKDQHKEAKKTTLNSILAQGFALQISRKSKPIENDSVKQKIGEEDAIIIEDDIKIEIDFCEIGNE